MKTRMRKITAVLLGILLILQTVPGFALGAGSATISEIVVGSDEGFRPALTIDNQKDGNYLLAGQQLTLMLPDEYTDVEWTTSDESVATVNDNGTVTGVGQGKVTITVTDQIDPQISASITLEIINPNVTYTVTYEVKYPSDAAKIVVSATEIKSPKDLTITEKTTPVVGSNPVRHMLWTGNFDVENYRMTGWKQSGTDNVYAQGQKVKLTGDTKYVAVFEKKAVARKQQSLTVNYNNIKEDGSEYYAGKGTWAGRGSTAYLETIDGAVYATFPLTDSKDGAGKSTEEKGSGLNFSVNPWYFAEKVMGLGKVKEITDEILAAYKEHYKSVIGFRLSEVKGVSEDVLTAYVKENYESGISSYQDHVFELGEVVTLPYGKDSKCYYFEPVTAGGKSPVAEVRVRVDGKGYYICQGELTELGMNTILKQPWPAANNGPYGGGSQDEQNLFGEPVNGKYAFTTSADPNGEYIAKTADVRTVLNKVGLGGENENNWEVVWFKLGQTRRGFLIEGTLVPKADARQMVIIASGSKTKLTYDGKEHEIEYTYESDDKDFDASKVKMVGDEPSRTDCGITLGSLTASNFKYEEKNVEAIFIVQNGSVWIGPAKLTITADNQEREATEADPEFTVHFDGLVNGETGEGLKYHVIRESEGSNAPGEYAIMVMGEATQGNYKISYRPGTLTIVGDETPRTVRVISSLDGVSEVYSGTEVTLTAIPEGFDGIEYTVQWSYVTPDGETHIISGANELTYTFRITSENAHYVYHVKLTPIQ